MQKIIGIDISKLTFDVAFLNEQGHWEYHQYKNEASGFKSFAALLGAEDWLIMEASGPYYLPLAYHFFERSLQISVLNPLVIKRYAQMCMYRAKTDVKDAKTIAEYAGSQKPKLWNPLSENNVSMRQFYSSIALLDKQIQMSQKHLEAAKSSGLLNAKLNRKLEKTIAFLQEQKESLEAELEQLANEEYQDSIARIKTIPGIGAKTAILLHIITDGITKFSNYKQLAAYLQSLFLKQILTIFNALFLLLNTDHCERSEAISFFNGEKKS